MRSHFSLDTDTDTDLFEQDPSFGTAFHKFFFNPRPTGGGGLFRAPPLSFSCDIFQTNAGVTTKLAVPSLPSILHIVWKF